MDKKELRRLMLQKRSEITREELLKKSSAIVRLLLDSSEYQQAEQVLLYADYNNEVRTYEIYKDARQKGKKVAYPVSSVINGIPTMEYYYISAIDELKAGYKGIMEPDTGLLPEKVENFEGICIIPGVAFDKDRNRMGYGKGFYDRFLREHDKLVKVALCMEVQLLEKIEADEYDVPMDIIITENGLKRE